MSPLILDGYIMAVDTSDTAHDDLLGKIVVAWNREKGLACIAVDSIRSHRRIWSRIIGIRVSLAGNGIPLAHHRQGAVVDRTSALAPAPLPRNHLLTCRN